MLLALDREISCHLAVDCSDETSRPAWYDPNDLYIYQGGRSWLLSLEPGVQQLDVTKFGKQFAFLLMAVRSYLRDHEGSIDTVVVIALRCLLDEYADIQGRG